MIIAALFFLASLHFQTAADLSEALRNNTTNATFSVTGRLMHDHWPKHDLLLVEDESGPVMIHKYFHKKPAIPLFAGSTIRITGHTRRKSGNLAVAAAIGSRIDFISKGTAPEIPEVSLRNFNQGLYDLRHIRLQGTVKEVFRDELSPNWIYIVINDKKEFTYAAFQHDENEKGDPFDLVGCRVSITGICSPNDGGARHHFGRMLISNNLQSLKILDRPSWWTPARLVSAIILLLCSLGLVILWNILLHVIVDRRTHALLREQLAHFKSELKINERTRLAVELHDSITQSLTGASMELRTANILSETDPAAMRRHLILATKSLDSCKKEIRNCIWDLRNLALEEPRIEEAIRKALTPHIDNVSLFIRFNVLRISLTDNVMHTLLCIIRELTINAVRHGKASTVKIAGKVEDGRILFSVNDNGHGFDPASAPGMTEGHFGLQGIRDRIESFSGNITIDSSPSAGTKVTVSLSLPLNPAKLNS